MKEEDTVAAEKMPHDHSIKIKCIGCEQETDYRITLPTAAKCEHCGMVFEVRLSLMKQDSSR